MNKKLFPVNQAKPPVLRNGRMHEVCGPSAAGFAAAICSDHKGTIIWIRETRQREQILPAGFMDFCNPGRIILVQGESHLDVLWAAEECLRARAAPIIIAELSRGLDFTQSRRLQLAASHGKSLGLLLVPEGMGSNAAETRWHCSPRFDPDDSTLQYWQLIKNKSGTLANWTVSRDEQAHRIIVVPEIGKPAHFAQALD